MKSPRPLVTSADAVARQHARGATVGLPLADFVAVHGPAPVRRSRPLTAAGAACNISPPLPLLHADSTLRRRGAARCRFVSPCRWSSSPPQSPWGWPPASREPRPAGRHQDRLQPAAHRQCPRPDRHHRQRHPARLRTKSDYKLGHRPRHEGIDLHDRVPRPGRRHRRGRAVDHRAGNRQRQPGPQRPGRDGLHRHVQLRGGEVSMPILNQAGCFMVSPANTAQSLTKPGTGDAARAGVLPADRQGQLHPRRARPTTCRAPLAAEWAQATSACKTVYILDDNEVYGKGDRRPVRDARAARSASTVLGPREHRRQGSRSSRP